MAARAAVAAVAQALQMPTLVAGHAVVKVRARSSHLASPLIKRISPISHPGGSGAGADASQCAACRGAHRPHTCGKRALVALESHVERRPVLTCLLRAGRSRADDDGDAEPPKKQRSKAEKQAAASEYLNNKLG